jgi:DNA-binding GntR family transcriptional regulator
MTVTAQPAAEMIDVRPLHERVYDILVSRMVAGSLSAGERLDAAEIAATLRVSRTPVKEALNRLAFEGLVLIEPRRGTTVALPSRQEVADLYDVMRMIGAHTVDAALANKTPAHVTELKALLKLWQEQVDGKSIRTYSTYLERDRNFHTYLVALAGNQRMLDIYRSVGLKIRLSYTLESQHSHDVRRSNKEHLEILAAFERGDAEALREAILRHYRSPVALAVTASA